MQELQDKKLQPIDLSPLSDAPLVSVLIANYNYARYISETLESVLCQTYPNYEIIVCDDGSTDNSCEVIENYTQKDSRIKLVRKPNGGVATALNAAYRESKGQIICLLDADDVWIDNKLQKTLEVFRSDPQCGFAIHNVIQIDFQGNFIKPTAMFQRLASGWLGPSALVNGGLVDNIPPASALSVRREVAELIFPLNEAFKRNADSLIFRFAPLITAIGAAPEVLSKFRLHGANTTSLVSVTPDFLEKDLVIMERVHQEQKLFVTNVYGAAIAQKLTDLKFSVLVSNSRYLHARLTNKSKIERKEIHQHLVANPRFHTHFNSLPQKWLVQWGEYLPNALFAAFFNLVYGSSQLKSFARWLFRRKLTASFIRG
ncbi:MAG: glycosyltransferase [Brasilonema octagenarum HA4186-MV1]|jgi:glycosyltransferase involved in cell wall biosynthesis|nr:glycosyltransferase [Brasilonema octagenarum HA4186-MV1]